MVNSAVGGLQRTILIPPEKDRCTLTKVAWKRNDHRGEQLFFKFSNGQVMKITQSRLKDPAFFVEIMREVWLKVESLRQEEKVANLYKFMTVYRQICLLKPLLQGEFVAKSVVDNFWELSAIVEIEAIKLGPDGEDLMTVLDNLCRYNWELSRENKK